MHYQKMKEIHSKNYCMQPMMMRRNPTCGHQTLMNRSCMSSGKRSHRMLIRFHLRKVSCYTSSMKRSCLWHLLVLSVRHKNCQKLMKMCNKYWRMQPILMSRNPTCEHLTLLSRKNNYWCKSNRTKYFRFHLR